MLTNIEPGGQAQAGPPWEAGGSVGSGNWWEEDWVGEELVGGVEGVARKEGVGGRTTGEGAWQGQVYKEASYHLWQERSTSSQQSSRDQVQLW